MRMILVDTPVEIYSHWLVIIIFNSNLCIGYLVTSGNLAKISVSTIIFKFNILGNKGLTVIMSYFCLLLFSGKELNRFYSCIGTFVTIVPNIWQSYIPSKNFFKPSQNNHMSFTWLNIPSSEGCSVQAQSPVFFSPFLSWKVLMCNHGCIGHLIVVDPYTWQSYIPYILITHKMANILCNKKSGIKYCIGIDKLTIVPLGNITISAISFANFWLWLIIFTSYSSIAYLLATFTFKLSFNSNLR